jgi:hypothetical protein
VRRLYALHLSRPIGVPGDTAGATAMSSTLPDRPVDEGTAYAMQPPAHNAKLTEVGRGTPMGELLRRYWHPVGLAAHAGATPRPVRVLGEDLILFRDGAGRPGLVHARCCHRGASLYYGRVRARHPLLLSRLALRRAGQLPRAALRARLGREAPPHRAPALVSGRGALRPRVRLHGAAAQPLPRFDALENAAGGSSTRTTRLAGAASSCRATGCSITRT